MEEHRADLGNRKALQIVEHFAGSGLRKHKWVAKAHGRIEAAVKEAESEDDSAPLGSRKRSKPASSTPTQSVIPFAKAPKGMSLSDGEEAALARRILRWAILNNVSIHVHQPSFSDIFDPLVQHFKLPSRQTMLSTMLRNEYLQARARAQQALSDPSVKSFCLCIDGWVSLRQQRYLGVTALAPHPIFLGSVMLPFAESADAIAAALRQIINSDLFIYTKEVRPGVIANVDLRTKINAVVSDRAAAMLRGIADLRAEFAAAGVRFGQTACVNHGVSHGARLRACSAWS